MDREQINRAAQHLQVGGPAPTVRTPSVDGSLLSIALRAKAIRMASDETLSEAIKYCMAVVGIRAQNLPTQEEKALLLSFIRRHFAGNTTAEMKLAFDMAAAGKLSIDARAFENFTCIYVASIMEAYRHWASNEVKQLQLDDSQKRTVSEQSGPVDWSDIWEECIERAFSDDFNHYFTPSAIYDWLEGKGEISVPNVDKWGFIEKARTHYIQELKGGRRSDLSIADIKSLIDRMTRDKWRLDQGIMSRLVNISKQLIIKEYAKACAKKRLDKGINGRGDHQQRIN